MELGCSFCSFLSSSFLWGWPGGHREEKEFHERVKSVAQTSEDMVD